MLASLTTAAPLCRVGALALALVFVAAPGCLRREAHRPPRGAGAASPTAATLSAPLLQATDQGEGAEGGTVLGEGGGESIADSFEALQRVSDSLGGGSAGGGAAGGGAAMRGGLSTQTPRVALPATAVSVAPRGVDTADDHPPVAYGPSWHWEAD